MIRKLSCAFVLAMVAATAAQAGDITITDAFARFMPGADVGAVYMTIHNSGAAEDHLVAASSPVAAMAHLQTHRTDDQGMMHMEDVAGGFAIPAGGSHALELRGDHVMLMGVSKPLKPGEKFDLTLTFQGEGDITLSVPVDAGP